MGIEQFLDGDKSIVFEANNGNEIGRLAGRSQYAAKEISSIAVESVNNAESTGKIIQQIVTSNEIMPLLKCCECSAIANLTKQKHIILLFAGGSLSLFIRIYRK